MKAQITIQLTWAFAIIAGISMLMFLMTSLGAEQEEVQVRGDIKLLNYLDAQIRSAAKTQNSFTVIEAPGARPKFFCDEPETSVFTIEGAVTTKPIPWQPIFSPEKLEGYKFLAWSRDWNAKVGSDRLLYLTGEDALLVVVQDNEGLWEKFVEKIPKGIPYASISSISIAREGYNNYRFVLFNHDVNALGEFFTNGRGSLGAVSSEVSAVNVKMLDPVDYRGSVDYYELVGMEWSRSAVGTVEFLGDPLLYAAVFAGNPDIYNCNLGKSLLKLRLQAAINKKRTEWIENALKEEDDDHECLRIMNDTEKKLSKRFEEFYDNPNPSIDDVKNIQKRLKRVGTDLQRGRNCPTL